MAVAKSNSIMSLENKPCNCYRVSSLVETILDTNRISKLDDRYVLGEQLGWGQFGIIRACSDKLTGEMYACKSIAKERLVTLDDVRSVKLEIEIMATLSGHPNVVDLKAVYEEEDHVHLVMELCAGGELFHRLEKYGRFPESEARILFRHLMQVVMYCHEKGVVHRDLKPENILLATKASSSPIKLADFGLATYIKPGTNLYGTVGSPFYIAPEVLVGGYNEAADVWSAGVILYILLSGMPPFWGKTKSRIFESVRAADLRFPSDPWDHISASAKDLISGMLCTDPVKRFTAAQVLEHSWIRDLTKVPKEPYDHYNAIGGQLDLGSDLCSTPFIARDQDVSFGLGSPITSVNHSGHSLAQTCRSSFSSFLVDSNTPCSASSCFSFRSCCEPNALEFSSPVSSMPSFAFFGTSAVEQENNPLGFSTPVMKVNAIQTDANLGKLFMTPNSSVYLGNEAEEMENKAIEVRRGGPTGSKMWGIHNKRNHTIGLGESEQLDLMVTESIIRWSSCTLLSTTPSLRSSLVC